MSVERLLGPKLRDKPVVVGGVPGQRGVVTSCSYEARALGVRSGMSLTEAVKLAPLPAQSTVAQATSKSRDRWCVHTFAAMESRLL